MKRSLNIRHFPAIIVILCICSEAFAQDTAKSGTWLNRLIQRSIADTTPPGKASIRFYPTLAYAPETSFEFGISSLLLYQAKNDTLNRLSEVNAFAFFTLENQYGLWIDNALYGDKDNWFFLGRTRLQQFPLLYYGTGPETAGEHPAIVDGNYILLRQRVLRKLRRNLFLGPEVDFQRLSRSRFRQPEDGTPYLLPEGAAGSANLGVGLALVYDNRHNVLNVRKGLFTELSFLEYNSGFLSDFDFRSVNLDLRSFHPMGNQQVLAWQVNGNFITGNAPFNQLALLGGDMMMRGYYQGRYRDKNLLAAQAEYRWLPFPFSKKFGGVVFGGLASVAPYIDQFRFSQIRPAGGAGIRYLLFPKKDIFLRLDVGFTKEGPGFYLYTGEAF